MSEVKLLVITSCPLLDHNNEPLQLSSVTQSRRCLHESLEGAKIRVTVKYVEHATAKIVQIDAQEDFDVLYYWGYGWEDGSLCFENEFGQEHLIPHSSFPKILNLNLENKTKLVLISACNSEKVADKIFELKIPVIAIKGEKPIDKQAAILFNQLFFHSWTHGMTLLEAFNEGVMAVENDANVGDKAYFNSLYYEEGSVPWSKRFMLKADSDQESSQLSTGVITDDKDRYKENSIDIPINLPQLTDNFLGRQFDIHVILNLLKNNKIVVVTGAFGLGKTEVIKAVSWYLQERGYYSNGIFWASARDVENRYHLKDLESLYNSILKTKNGKLSDQTSLEKKAEEVEKIFSSGETLLVLDNLEIIEKDIKLQAFLKDLPNSSKVLIATRHNIPQLAYNYELGFLAYDSCMELFLNTLNGTGYFQRQQENLEDTKTWIRKIISYLGGHPIALEITAGRGLSCALEDIWEELIDYPEDVLEQVDDMSDKQEGVWTSLDLSYNDLSEKQKNLFYRLSIFTRPVDKKAIRKVLETPNLLSTLNALVRRSLIKHKDNTYFFLPVIKMYAESKLKESKEDMKSLHRQAVDYYKQQDVSGKIRAIDHLKFFCLEGDEEAGEELLNLTLDIDEELFKLGQWNLDKDTLKESLEILQKLKNRKAEAQLLNQLGEIARHRGELDNSETLYNTALKLFEDLNNVEGISRQHDNLGMLYRQRGELDKAELAHNDALTISREHKNQPDEARILMRLGLVYLKMGKLEQAEQVYNESLKIREQLKDVTGMAAVWANMGMVYKYQGKLKDAEDILSKSLEVFQEEGYCLGQANQLNKLGLVYLCQKQDEKAGDFFRKSTRILARFKTG